MVAYRVEVLRSGEMVDTAFLDTAELPGEVAARVAAQMYGPGPTENRYNKGTGKASCLALDGDGDVVASVYVEVLEAIHDVGTVEGGL